jgi:hypothetical protein
MKDLDGMYRAETIWNGMDAEFIWRGLFHENGD